jgi:Mn2+/Fe2+ NRAMP family transporter
MKNKNAFPPLTKSLFAMLGPSVVFVALSLNGGEMLLWPSLVANFGLKLLWPILIILLLQFVVNIEIERYTLVTGKRVEEALVEHKAWLAVVFAFTVIAALMWPAWMSTAGNIIAVIFGVPAAQERNIGLVLAMALLGLSILVFRKPNIYKVLEKIARVGLATALGIIVLVVITKFNASIFWEGVRGLLHFGYLPKNLPRFDFVGALAYGGVAGVLNLVQSVVSFLVDIQSGVGPALLPRKCLH